MVDYNPKDNVVLYDKKVIKIPSKNGGYCYRCGKYSGSSHKMCAYCGGDLFTIQHTTVPKKVYNYRKKVGKNNAWIGVICGLFIPFFGFLIGLGYDEGTIDKKTFIDGYVGGVICRWLLSVIVGILIYLMNFAFIYSQIPNF